MAEVRWFAVLLCIVAVGCGEEGAQPVAKPDAEVTEAPPASADATATTESAEAAAAAAAGDAGAPAEDASAVAAGEAALRAKREPIYDVEADGEAVIAAALERARHEHKHVLIEWGGNWCGWCYRLHDVFTEDQTVRPIVHEEFELVLLDSTANRALMETYGGKERQYSYPHLTVLGADGNVLVNQNTEPLEVGPRHDPEKVAEFLKKWAPERVDAADQLASALRRAADEDKRVLVHVGTPYCGWCRVLDRFLREHADLFAGDYVDLKIDTLRMEGGEAVASRFVPGNSPGVPWMVILDSAGQVLATSVGPDGNCGYPYHSHEVEHFVSMLTATRQRMTDAEVAEVRAALERYREEQERKRQAEEEVAGG